MKKLFFLILAILFLKPAVIFAVDVQPSVPEATPSPAVVEYALPYPGMLPDNPLYFVKQIRDFIMERVIMDPIRKSEFYILQGDKRVAMGMALSAKGKAAVGEQVISKGEKYLYNTVSLLVQAKSQGKEVPAYIIERAGRSLAKHEEVIRGELAKAAEEQKAGLTSSLTLIKQLQEQLAGLK